MKLLNEYQTHEEESICLFEESGGFTVECFDKDDNCRWSKRFGLKTEAELEFERWRINEKKSVNIQKG